VHELACLRARRFAFALVFARALDRLSLRHHLLPRKYMQSVTKRARAVLHVGSSSGNWRGASSGDVF
jgi:hypothetical protein